MSIAYNLFDTVPVSIRRENEYYIDEDMFHEAYISISKLLEEPISLSKIVNIWIDNKDRMDIIIEIEDEGYSNNFNCFCRLFIYN